MHRSRIVLISMYVAVAKGNIYIHLLNRPRAFSDQKVIMNSIKLKNKSLSNDLKLNIIAEQSKSKISKKLTVKNISINSKMIKKNDAAPQCSVPARTKSLLFMQSPRQVKENNK